MTVFFGINMNFACESVSLNILWPFSPGVASVSYNIRLVSASFLSFHLFKVPMKLVLKLEN